MKLGGVGKEEKGKSGKGVKEVLERKGKEESVFWERKRGEGTSGEEEGEYIPILDVKWVWKNERYKV